INLGNSGKLVNENENSYVFSTGNGYLESQVYLDHPTAVNPGNLGVFITAPSTPGNTIIRRGHLSQLPSAEGTNSLLRYIDIIPANNQALNASVKFSYLDNELDQLNESQVVLLKDDHNNWTPV